jgi:hypothetical protein
MRGDFVPPHPLVRPLRGRTTKEGPHKRARPLFGNTRALESRVDLTGRGAEPERTAESPRPLERTGRLLPLAHDDTHASRTRLSWGSCTRRISGSSHPCGTSEGPRRLRRPFGLGSPATERSSLTRELETRRRAARADALHGCSRTGTEAGLSPMCPLIAATASGERSSRAGCSARHSGDDRNRSEARGSVTPARLAPFTAGAAFRAPPPVRSED